MLLDLVLDGFLCAFSAPLRLCASAPLWWILTFHTITQSHLLQPTE